MSDSIPGEIRKGALYGRALPVVKLVLDLPGMLPWTGHCLSDHGKGRQIL